MVTIDQPTSGSWLPLTHSWGDFEAIAGKAVLTEAGPEDALIDWHCRLGGKQQELEVGIGTSSGAVFGELVVLARSEQGP